MQVNRGYGFGCLEMSAYRFSNMTRKPTLFSSSSLGQNIADDVITLHTDELRFHLRFAHLCVHISLSCTRNPRLKVQQQ